MARLVPFFVYNIVVKHHLILKSEHQMKIAKIITVAAVVCASASPALAWGDREQGALVGIGALLLGQSLAAQSQYAPQQEPQHQYNAPDYSYQQRPQYDHHPHHHWRRESVTTMDICHFAGQRVRVYDAYGRVIGFRYC